MYTRPYFNVNEGYVIQAIKIRLEFCDLYAHVKPILLLCCKFLIIMLKTVKGVAEIQTLLCLVYKAIFQCK